MKQDGTQPAVEQSARGLGVRAEGTPRDVEPDGDGMVYPRGGGMSVAPDDPMNLQQHRRPEDWGGTGKDPLWQITVDDVPAELEYRSDKIGHGLVEPANAVLLEDYREHLAGTAPTWSLKPYE